MSSASIKPLKTRIGNNVLIIIWSTKVTTVISFEQILNTENGLVSGVQLIPSPILVAAGLVDKSQYKFEIKNLQKTM
jgi:hypothetical protein